MTFSRFNAASLALCVAASAQSVAANEAESITSALKNGTTTLNLRTRIEHVDEDNAATATATTLRTRLSYTSASFKGFGLMLEMDDTTELVDQDYTDGVTPRGTSPIADPEVTEVNQAYLSYKQENFTVKYGRQRILLDNQRFVGGVGWRQDEQTYDALSITATPVKSLSLFAARVTDVNRIFAEEGDHNHETYLLNGKFKTDVGNLIGYGYLIDNKTTSALSSDTFGLRWEGKINDSMKYNLEYAKQSDAADNPQEYSANYTLVEFAITFPVAGQKFTVNPGFEILGSDDGATAFKTPLATLHAFQGWTDKFLQTPSSGVEDTYLTIKTQLSDYKFSITHHMLSANEGSQKYGTETGFVIAKKFKPVTLILKGAQYSADTLGNDTAKVWLMASMSF